MPDLDWLQFTQAFAESWGAEEVRRMKGLKIKGLQDAEAEN